MSISVINEQKLFSNNDTSNKEITVTVCDNVDNTKVSEHDEKNSTEKAAKAMAKAEFLGNGPLLRTIWSLTYPDFIAKLMQALYSIVDSMFIGQYAGDSIEEKKNALAGLSLASPIEMCIIVGFSLIFAQGGGPLYGRYLGKHDEKTSRRIIGNTFMMEILLGIVMAIILPLSAKWLLTLLGASEAAGTLQPATEYIIPLMYADILYNLSYSTNNLMRGEGAALFSSSLMIISSLSNIIFDFILVKILSIGIRGAAFSTVLAYTLASAFGLWFFISRRSAVAVQWSDFRIDWKLVGQIMNTGLSGLVIGLANGILSIVSNRLILAYSPSADSPETTAAVAAAGSMAKMQYFCFIPINSIAHGVVALLSYCRGAKKYNRFMSALKVCFVGQLIVCAILSLLCLCFSNEIASLFNGDSEFRSIFSKGLKYMAMLLCLSPFSCTMYPALQAIGRGAGSATVLFCRSCLFYILFQMIICKILGNYWGVFMAYPLADVASALFSLIFFICVRKEMKGDVISVTL